MHQRRVSPAFAIPRRGSRLSRGINSPPFPEQLHAARLEFPLLSGGVNLERFGLEESQRRQHARVRARGWTCRPRDLRAFCGFCVIPSSSRG